MPFARPKHVNVRLSKEPRPLAESGVLVAIIELGRTKTGTEAAFVLREMKRGPWIFS